MPRAAAAKNSPAPQKEIPPGNVTIDALAWSVVVKVDWAALPILEAQQAYDILQKAYLQAGKILNERSMDRSEHFHCFMAGTDRACKLGVLYTGRPMFIDNAYKAPHGGHKDSLTGQITPEGLYVQVRICSERCHALYQAKLIQERRDRELGK